MDAKTLAGQLTGFEYPLRMDDATNELARQSGLLVIYGYSDDSMRLSGIISNQAELNIDDELTLFIEPSIPLAYDEPDSDSPKVYYANGAFEEMKPSFFQKHPQSESVFTVKMGTGPDGAFEVFASIPGESFEIMDEGNLYCRGMVVSTR